MFWGDIFCQPSVKYKIACVPGSSPNSVQLAGLTMFYDLMFSFQYHMIKLLLELTKITLALQGEANHIRARLHVSHPVNFSILSPASDTQIGSHLLGPQRERRDKKPIIQCPQVLRAFSHNPCR